MYQRINSVLFYLLLFDDSFAKLIFNHYVYRSHALWVFIHLSMGKNESYFILKFLGRGIRKNTQNICFYWLLYFATASKMLNFDTTGWNCSWATFSFRLCWTYSSKLMWSRRSKNRAWVEKLFNFGDYSSVILLFTIIVKRILCAKI